MWKSISISGHKFGKPCGVDGNWFTEPGFREHFPVDSSRRQKSEHGVHSVLFESKFTQFNLLGPAPIWWTLILMDILGKVAHQGKLCESGPRSAWWWNLACLSVNNTGLGFVVANYLLILPGENSPQPCYPKPDHVLHCKQRTCHLDSTLGTFSRKKTESHGKWPEKIWCQKLGKNPSKSRQEMTTPYLLASIENLQK